MTTLAQLVWDCRTIGWMDKLVLMGWAEQVPDGSDLAYASKETVADFLKIGLSTVKRHTKALVKRGVLIDTGGQKQWKNGWTPVFQVNLESLIGQPSTLTPSVNLNPVHSDPQGSRFTGLSSSSSCSTAGFYSETSGQEPTGRSKEIGKPENLEPKTVEPKPSPHAQKKVCPDCKEPLQRDVNHFLSCPVAKGKSTLDEYLGDLPPRPNPNYGGEMMEFEDWQLRAEPLDWKQERTGEAAGQKSGEDKTGEGKPTDIHAHSPVAAARTPECEFCTGRCRCDDPVPPLESPRPMGIHP